MKRVLMAVVLCVVGGSVYAQSPSADYIGRHGAEIDQAKLEKVLDRKTALSALKVGKYLFTLRPETTAEEQNGNIHTYLYRPEGVAAFQEAVNRGVKNERPKLISHAAAVNRLLGPFNWTFEDYEISEIEITIYPDDHLFSLAQNWTEQFGKECVAIHRRPLSRPIDLVEMRHTPTSAFVTKEGETVVISAYASSKEFGPYRRECRPYAAGALYEEFQKTTRELKKALSN